MFALMLVLAGQGAGPATPPPDLSWLAGQWCTDLVAGRQTCENWGPARGGTMLGTSQTMRDGRTRGFEYMRIELGADAVVFHASPGGAPAVAFREAGRARAAISFVNPANDYPQRIRYWRDGAALMAEITLADGSKPTRWRYHRVR